MRTTPTMLLSALLASSLLAFPGAPCPGAEGEGVLKSEFIYDERPPTRSCHASTLAQGRDGNLVAAWFGGTDEGERDVSIWFARHDGQRWGAPAEAADGVTRSDDGQERRFPCWNPVLFQPPGDGQGRNAPLLLFYKVGPRPDAWWGMLKTSPDGGRTWSEARRLPNGILGPVKNKPALLSDGTLLCGSSTEDNGWRVHMEWTKDLGQTWGRTDPLNDGRKLGAIQPALLLPGGAAGGKVLILCRSRQGRIAAGRSDDGGRTWPGGLTLTDLPNPNSGLDAVTLSDGRHLLVYNHTPGGRTPLNVAVSDDGLTWKAGPVLEAEPGEYSYPAVIQASDGTVHVTYTWKRQRIRHVALDPAKFRLQDLPGRE